MLAEEKSYTKAAQRLFISQPSLTVSISRLEKAFRSPLLVRRRGSKELQLTDDGQIVLTHAQKIMREIDIINKEVSSHRKIKVALGVPPIIGAYLFPRIARSLTPDDLESLDLIETGSEKMKNLLLDGKVDMCFIGTQSPLVSGEFDSHFIMRDSYSIIVNKNDPLARRKSVDFRELRNARFISLGKDFVQYSVLKGLCDRHGMSGSVMNFVITNEIQTAKLLVSNGVGIGFMISSEMGKMPDLVAIPLVEPAYFYIYFVWKKEREFSDFETAIKDDLVKAVQNLQRESRIKL
jgi:DNA-binding transcriptional LysR family regulator